MIKNKMAFIFMVFTLLTVTSSIIGLIQGIESTGNLHIVMRFAITFLAFGSLYIFEVFMPRFKFYQVHIMHYVLTMAAALLLVAFSGLFVELHPNAYRDIFLNFTAIYIIIVMSEFVFHAFWSRYRKSS